MNGRFLYVFNSEDRDRLLSLGFSLLADSHDGRVFIFANKANHNFSADDFDFVVTDVITFDIAPARQ